MLLGFGLPQCGSLAHPDALTTIAQRLEQIGYHSLWTFERLLYPVEPRTPYPASADGRLPELAKAVLDPLDALTFVAPLTRRIRLGTSVLNLPFYNPVMLARRLTSLDVLSRGRLTVGLGLGWSVDEFEAAGASMSDRGERADEFLDLLRALWGPSPASFEGRHYRLAPSLFELRPVQQPHPPLLLAAYTPAAMSRVARKADGWNPAGLPLPALKAMWAGILEQAHQAGRDPSQLQLVGRGNLVLLPQALPEEGRFPFVGSLEQIVEDIKAHREAGVQELILDLQFSPGMLEQDRLLETAAALWQAAKHEGPSTP
jgi:probable F420-dependent oxidoreductase